MFSALWWRGLLFSLATITAIVLAGRYSHRQNKERIAFFSGLLLIAIALFLPLYQLLRNEWTVQSSLPLNLCSLSGFLSGLVLLWRNQLAFEFLLYWGISGATYSLLTPELTMGSKGWYLYDYYLSHAGILFSCFYLVLVLRMRPREGSWLKVFLLTQLVVLTVGITNWLIGANYMYLMQKPAVENPFVIGEWPWYILGMEAAGLLHFFVAYLLFKRYQSSRKNATVTA